jgi:hypothetical protein
MQNNMLKISKANRDEIVRWMRTQIVPSEVGAGMIQIATMLTNLEEIKDDTKKEEPVKKDK